ncbi:zona pellucida sperm-binding protein 3-like [Sardina pilchardus]|uniref:zona pellucida sperm-binding protein 3-like n=1 Tax=Sardina pilchardus TaxID=27697 RepID=UPI002E0D7F9B
MAVQIFPNVCVAFVSLGLVCDAQHWNMPLLLRGLNDKPPTLPELGQVMLETNELEVNGPVQNLSSLSPEPQQLGTNMVQSAKPAQLLPRGYQPILFQPEPMRTAQGSNALEPEKPALAQGPLEHFRASKPGKLREHSMPQRTVIEPSPDSVKREMVETSRGHHSFVFRNPSHGPVNVESQKAPGFELREPEPIQTVAVECRESSVQVRVHQELLWNGQLIEPTDLTMGGCHAEGYDDEARVLFFESELQRCGSKITMTKDKIIYTFTLVYNPSPLPGTSIVRTNEATVDVECIYPRKHNVSSSALKPTWMPYASTKETEEVLIFSLHLMTDDWKFERPSDIYFLGDVMNVEASVQQAHHEPLRVFADSCVATAGPDINALPRYSFIENHGCFTDARETGSNAQYMQRVQDNKLRFQLRAFKFLQQDTNSIYITCHLKATLASTPTDSAHKGCSFSAGRNSWLSADDGDEVCSCCDSSCAVRKARSLTSDGLTLQGKAALGPITMRDRPAQERLEASPEIQESSHFSVEEMVFGGIIAAAVVVSLMALGSILYRRLHKPTVPCEDT